MPRRDLTLAEKIAILDIIKNQPSNTNKRRLAEMTGVPKSTIGRLICLEGKLREEWTVRGDLGKSQKRKREGKNPKVEEALNQWYSVATVEGERINGPMLRSKSEELAKQLGIADFKATDGWLSRWKTRHHIRFKKVSDGDGAIPDEATKQVGSRHIDAVDLLYYIPPVCSLNFDAKLKQPSSTETDKKETVKIETPSISTTIHTETAKIQDIREESVVAASSTDTKERLATECNCFDSNISQENADFGKFVSQKLHHLSEEMAIHCKNVINEVIIEAQNGNLNISSRVLSDPLYEKIKLKKEIN